MPDEVEIAYLSYKRWIENGGQELYLSGFKLTNLQMFWLCVTHVFTLKFNHNTPADINQEAKLFGKYMHVVLKSSPYFRETYRCDAMTGDENKRYQEFNEQYDLLRLL